MYKICLFILCKCSHSLMRMPLYLKSRLIHTKRTLISQTTTLKKQTSNHLKRPTHTRARKVTRVPNTQNADQNNSHSHSFPISSLCPFFYNPISISLPFHFQQFQILYPTKPFIQLRQH